MLKFPERMFATIPLSILTDNDLKFSSRVIYALIANLTQAKGCCYAKNSYFTDAFDISEKSLSLCLAELERKGYIRVVNAGRRRMIYTPFEAKFQTAKNNVSNAEVSPGVLEICEEIKKKQRDKYPACSFAGPYGGAVNDILLILAKAVYDSEYLGTKLGDVIVTDTTMKDLADLIDINDLHNLANYVMENGEDIFNINRYILTGVIKIYKKELADRDNERLINAYKARRLHSATKDKVSPLEKYALDKNKNQPNP